MMNRSFKKVFSVLLVLCLALGLTVNAGAETVVAADFEAMLPVMDLVCMASQYSPNAPETVPGAGSELSVSFVDAFFKVANVYGGALGMADDVLTNTAAQAELLKKVFAADAPQLQAVSAVNDMNGYIGFQPVLVNSGANGSGIQVIGEMYLADKPMNQMNEADFANISWIDRAVFVLESDVNAMGGFRVNGFSVGTDLAYEEAMLAYDESITVEYESKLGFMILYPSFFTDDMLSEDENGVSAKLPDGSASFFAKRMNNENGAELAEHVAVIANGITGSIANVNEEMQYGTVTYTSAEGQIVFDVYVVTEDYIFQAELCYPASMMSEYSMYTSYLENSFVINELSQG